MAETIESLGIGQHLREEITSVLDETYRCWLQGEEEIFLDPATCALAFRTLRVNGYDVSSEPLAGFAEETFFNSLGGYLNDLGAVLELFRASEMIIHPDEQVLKKQNAWTSHFLKQELSYSSMSADKHKEYSVLKFVEYWQQRLPKTSSLAVEDFNACQSINREELKQLERWVQVKRLDMLKFARQKLGYSYFSAAATIFSPELSDARLSMAKNSVLATVVDNFFDVAGSEEELLNLMQLVEKHDVDGRIHCCSEKVEILFSALHSTISEIGERAIAWQGRNLTTHVTEIWLDLLRSMWQETQWLKNKSVPTVDEYMINGCVSFALGSIILPALYSVGPRLSEVVAKSPEYNLLFKLVSTCGRLLNDFQTFTRESMEGKLNAVSLHITHGTSTVTEDVNQKLKRVIDDRRELLRLVLQENGSMVPRACKELFWKMSKVLHLFYMKDDGFTSHEMTDFVNAVIYDPIVLDGHQLQTSEGTKFHVYILGKELC